MKKLIISFFCLTLIAQLALAQSEGSVFTATGSGGLITTITSDYHALGINPANLGIPNQQESTIAFGLAEMGLSIYSDALNKKGLLDSMLNFSGNSGFNAVQKKNASKRFANAGTALNVDVMPAGFGIYVPKIGGFAISVNERMSAFVKLNKFTSNVLFQGFNFADYFGSKGVNNQGDSIGVASNPQSFSSLANGTKLNFNWTRTFNLGYGREIISKEDKYSLYGGIGLKYVLSFASIDIDVDNNTLGGHAAVSPLFGIDLSGINTPSQLLDSTGLKPIGKGYGIDLGATFVYKKKLRLALSVIDLVAIKYNGNLIELQDFKLDSLQSQGFDSYNIFSQVGNVLDGEGLFPWKGALVKKVAMPGKIRMGVSFAPIEQITVGLDALIPLNDVTGNFTTPQIALGANFKLAKVINLSTGFAMGVNKTFNLPFGFVISTKFYDFGFSTRDIIVIFGQGSPHLSASVGLLRFKF